MTKRYSETNWRGSIYNALRRSSGGIAGFCAWAAACRDRCIHPKTLYKRLDGTNPSERLTIEDAELMTEYMSADIASQATARDWIIALAARFELACIPIDAPPAGGGWPCEITAIFEKHLTLSQQHGQMAAVLGDAVRDKRIDPGEAEAIKALAHEKIRMLLRLVRNVERAAETGETLGQAEYVESAERIE